MTSAFGLEVRNKTAVSICTILSRLSRKKTTPLTFPPRDPCGGVVLMSNSQTAAPLDFLSLIPERRAIQREGMDFGFIAGHVAGPLEESTLLDGKGGGVHIAEQFSR